MNPRWFKVGGPLLLLVAAVAAALFYVFPSSGSPQAAVGMGQGQDQGQPSTSTPPNDQSLLPGSDCANKLDLGYYPVAAKVREHNFTPPITATQPGPAVEQISRNICNDPYVTAAFEARWGWADATDGAITTRGDQLKNDPAAWRQVLGRLYNWLRDPNTKVTIEDIRGPYWSYYMLPGANEESVIIKKDSRVQPRNGYKKLVLTNGGTRIEINLECTQPMGEGTQPTPDKFTPTPERTPPGTTTTNPPGTGGCEPNCTTTTTPPNTCVQGDQRPECIPPKKNFPNPSGVTSPPRPNPPHSEPAPTHTGPPLQPGSGTTTTTTTRTSIPPNQGDDSDGRVTG